MKNLAIKITLSSIDIFSYHYDNIKDKIIKQIDEDYYIDNYLYFPVILNHDNTQWEHANRYLLYKLRDYKQPSPKTLDTIASDLKDFKNFCNKHDINYLIANRKATRPNWLYREYLQKRLTNNEISPNTLKRKIASVIGFYVWLIEHENIKFKLPLWNEKVLQVPYINDIGLQKTKEIVTRDISYIPIPKNANLYNNTIVDGRTLSPLSQKEQVDIFNALKKSNNTEMKFIFSIALFTGARIQTVCTLRLIHFNKKPTPKEDEVRILIGNGTFCDTKYSKLYTLFFPKWLYEQIQIYIHSEISTKRRNKALHIFDDEKLHYVFLTNRGRPYYASRNDSYRNLYMKPPSGESIRKFISERLKQILVTEGKNIDFSFHDLRATYGINFVDFNMKYVDSGDISFSQLLSALQERMGHSNIETTKHYLIFRNKNAIAIQAHNDFEKFMKSLLHE